MDVYVVTACCGPPVAVFLEERAAKDHADKLNAQEPEDGCRVGVEECPLMVSPEHCSACSTKEKNE